MFINLSNEAYKANRFTMQALSYVIFRQSFTVHALSIKLRFQVNLILKFFEIDFLCWIMKNDLIRAPFQNIENFKKKKNSKNSYRLSLTTNESLTSIFFPFILFFASCSLRYCKWQVQVKVSKIFVKPCIVVMFYRHNVVFA